jgi:cellulose synthase (UDP-forming)
MNVVPIRSSAPTGAVRNEAVIRLAAVLAVTWGAVYLAWRAVETWQGTEPVLFILLFACELFGWAMLVSFCFLAWRIPATTRPPIRQPHRVDVLVCTYDEGLDVLEATLLGCAGISYPHVTWVLDDGHRDAVRALAERTGARYVTRPDNSNAKAGNINHALRVVHGDLLLVLDADHVPQPDILDATVGYFDDPKVALVQTPQDFSNQDSFQHFETGRHDQSMFFEVILPGKDRHNGVFWCGSAAVIRRDALAEVGGVATETIAEDFHTTIKMHARGWKTRYHGETLVQGLAPHDLSSYLLQRDRWARGNLTVFRTPQNPLTARNLSVAQRVSYLSSLLAYFVPVQRLCLLAVLTTMLVSGQLPFHATLAGFLIFWVPWIAVDLIASTLLCRGRASLWDGTYSLLLTMQIFARACFVVLRPTASTFRVTPKDGIDDGGRHALNQLHLLIGIGAVLSAAIVLRGLTALGLASLPRLAGAPLVIGLVLGVWELGLVVAVLGKVSRRRQLRRHYRTPTEMTGRAGGEIVQIVDLTPGGAGLIAPHALSLGQELELVAQLPDFNGGTHPVRLCLTVSTCCTDGAGLDRWRVGGTITPVGREDHDQLVAYCHVGAARTRLAESGRLLPVAAASNPPEIPVAAPHGRRRQRQVASAGRARAGTR